MAEPRSRGAGISQQRETESRVGGGGEWAFQQVNGFFCACVCVEPRVFV